jgi:maltose alpha-D-glucosyltransferase/alpha-amylase
LADAVLGRQDEILARLAEVGAKPFGGKRIRCHGDYHLGQVLYTGKDFYIIDSEGEPARAVGERKVKRSPLRDVAGMLRSFDHAVQWSLRSPSLAAGGLPEGYAELLGQWGSVWAACAGASFLKGYLERVAGSGLVPGDVRALRYLLDILTLEKAPAELGSELENRPGWAAVPLSGILAALEHQAAPAAAT